MTTTGRTTMKLTTTLAAVAIALLAPAVATAKPRPLSNHEARIAAIEIELAPDVAGEDVGTYRLGYCRRRSALVRVCPVVHRNAGEIDPKTGELSVAALVRYKLTVRVVTRGARRWQDLCVTTSRYQGEECDYRLRRRWR